MRALKFILVAAIGIATLVKCSKDGSSTADASFGGEGLAGSTARFAIANNTLYTVDNTNLNIFNLNGGAKPTRAGKFALGMNIETISARGNTLFIGSMGGVYIIDVTNPVAPVQLGLVQHITSCDPVAPDGDYAFVTLSNNTGCRGINELQILNIQNLQNAYILRRYPMSNPRGLAVSGKWLFICDNGVKMYDKTDINNLNLTDYKQGIAANDVIADNNTLIVTATDGIYQYDYSSGALVFKSKIPITL